MTRRRRGQRSARGARGARGPGRRRGRGARACRGARCECGAAAAAVTTTRATSRPRRRRFRRRTTPTAGPTHCPTRTKTCAPHKRVMRTPLASNDPFTNVCVRLTSAHCDGDTTCCMSHPKMINTSSSWAPAYPTSLGRCTHFCT